MGQKVRILTFLSWAESPQRAFCGVGFVFAHLIWALRRRQVPQSQAWMKRACGIPEEMGQMFGQRAGCPLLEEQAVSRKLFPCLRPFGPFSTIGPTIFYLTQMENRRFPALTSKGCQSLHFQQEGVSPVGPGDWVWVSARSWWGEEVCRGV